MRTSETEAHKYICNARRAQLLRSLRTNNLVFDNTEYFFVSVHSIEGEKVNIHTGEGNTYARKIQHFHSAGIYTFILLQLGFEDCGSNVYTKDSLKMQLSMTQPIIDLEVNGQHKEVIIYDFHVVQNFYKDVTGEELIRHEIKNKYFRYKPYGL